MDQLKFLFDPKQAIFIKKESNSMNAVSRQSISPVVERSTGRDILLVDSELSLRLMLSRLLSEKGHSVRACGSLLDALNALSVHRFDFVITDHSTSGIDGLCLLEAIKQHDSEIPVLVTSSQYEKGPYIIAMNLGALDYLIKPVDFAVLQRVILSQS